MWDVPMFQLWPNFKTSSYGYPLEGHSEKAMAFARSGKTLGINRDIRKFATRRYFC